MQRLVAKPLIQRTISLFSLNPAKTLNHIRTKVTEPREVIEHVADMISWTEEDIEDANAYKHTHRDKYLMRSRSHFDELSSLFNEARSKLPAEDEIVLSLEPKISRLEADVKKIEDDYRTIYIGEYALGLVLRIYEGRAKIRSFEVATEISYNKIGQVFNDSRSALSWYYEYLMGNYIRDDDMQLMKWIEVQIQLMKDEVKYLDEFQRFMETNPWFAKDATKILETISTSPSSDKEREKTQEKDSGIRKIDDFILDTIIKIAKARYMFCSAFEADCYRHLDREGHIRLLLREIERSSRSYDNLMAKIPENYDMTLRRWMEMNIKPEVEKVVENKCVQQS